MSEQPEHPVPPRRGRVAPATVGVGVVAGLLAVLACVMIVQGLPLRTATHQWLLDLSSMPLSVAVALVVARVVVERGMLRRRVPGAPLPRLFLAGAVLVVVGVLMWVVVLSGGRAPVLNPGGAQTVLWLGLGSWCLWVLLDRERRRRSDGHRPDRPLLGWTTDPDD